MAFLMAVLTGVVIFVVCIACKVMAAERGSESRIRITLAVGLAVIVVIWIWFFNWSSSPDRVKEQVAKDCENTTMAYVMSQNFVKQRLKAPSTAEFPSVTDNGVRVRAIPNCSFNVSAYVDAQNAFGAPIRNNYTAVMSYESSTKLWRATQLSID